MLAPLDHPVFQSDLVQVGAFQCSVHDRRFRDSGPVENYLVVFPRNGVWIRHAGSREFVADPQVATIYNRGQEYTRAPLSSDGDRCDWFAVSPAMAIEIALTFDARADRAPDRPFRGEFAFSSHALYLRQRRLFLNLQRGMLAAADAEERVLNLVSDVIERSIDSVRVAPIFPRTEEAQRDLVERARARIVLDFASNTSISVLAGSLGVSPFHLCRTFRKRTGMSLHEYRLELRQRMVLERLLDAKVDLSRLALEFGFSSHSHLTATLRRRSGMTPTMLKQLLSKADQSLLL